MKKITSLVACMLMFFVGNVMAQRGWVYNPDSIVTEIIPGEDINYLIQQGFGPSNAKPVDGFLNSGNEGVLIANGNTLDHSCVFNFIKAGEKEANGETFTIFILKNVATGEYVTDNENRFTASPLEAFQFTARIAVSKEMSPELKSDWYEYSNAINGGKCPGAEGVNWVFCHPESFKFMAFNNNPGWSTGYVTATNWRVYRTTEKPMSAQEKFMATYEKYFYDGVDETIYPIGTNPGCINKELYDVLLQVYKEAEAASYNNNLTDEEYNRLNQLLQDLVVRIEAERVPLTAGYYCLCNQEKGFLAETGSARCDGGITEMPTEWTIENAKYIWKIEDLEDIEGKFYIQSAFSEKYITKGETNEYIMTPKGKTAFSASIFKGNYWNIKDKNLLHAKPKDGSLNNYGKAEDAGNLWQFYSVKEEAFENIHNEIIQTNLNRAMTERVKEITVNIEGLKNKCGLTMNGNYAKNAAGLVSQFESANASDTHPGSDEKFAFDRNVETVYQTEWSNNAPASARHWVQVDFTEPLQDIIVKFTRRLQHNSVPTRIGMYAAEGDDPEAVSWAEEVYEDTVIYQYPTEFSDTIADSTTYIQTIKLNRPVQHVRFTVTQTDNNKYWNEGGPTWCVGELRFYKAENNKENPSFNLIPKDTLEALNTVLLQAKAELEAGKATQETFDALDAAMTSVMNTYPNPASLRGAIEAAMYRYEVAQESEDQDSKGWGYYQVGAKDEYLKALNVITTELKDENKVFTLDDIDRLEKQLQATIDAFNARLIVPTDGVYQIICKAGINPNNGEEYPEEGSFIASANADYNSPAVWAYKNDIDIPARWNALWKIEKNSEGKFSFKNLGSGLYLDNPYEGLSEEEQDTISTTTPVYFSESPKYITLEASPIAGQFMLTLKSHRYLNASGQKMVGTVGRPMAIWNDYKNGSRSRFFFRAVSQANLSDGVWKINCQPNSYQIFSLPIELEAAYTSTSDAYKVIGVKNGFVELDPYEFGEIIPAGTAFIIKSGKEDMSFDVLPTAVTLEALQNVTYNYDPVVTNGLVSAPRAFIIGEGYGMIFQDKIAATTGVEEIKAGTGFFNNAIPTTTVDGAIHLELTADLTGEGTLVETVISNPKAMNDVYTLTGLKIRQNVKGADAIKGLPRGIYIVGGKKMIVK